MDQRSNIRPETLKQLQKIVENILEHTGIRNSMAQNLRERMNKWDCNKLKSFCTAKESVTRLKRQPTKWEKIFASYLSDKGLTFRIHRELKNSPLNKQHPNEEMGT
jgi:adenosine deaminase